MKHLYISFINLQKLDLQSLSLWSLAGLSMSAFYPLLVEGCDMCVKHFGLEEKEEGPGELG